MPSDVLKKYRVKDTEPGMVLARTVLDEKGKVILNQGKVILQEGTALTRALIDRLLNWNVRVVDVRLPAGIIDKELSGESLSSTLDLLVQRLGKQFTGENIFLSILEGDPPRWWVLATASSFRLDDASLESKFQSAEYLAGNRVSLPDLSACRVPPALARADMLSLLGVPIRVANRTVGVIELFSPHMNAFPEERCQLVEAVAREAAFSIHTSQLSQSISDVTTERDLLHEVMDKVAVSSEPEKLLEAVSDHVGVYLNAHAVAAFIVHRLSTGIHPVDVVNRHFSRNDIEFLKELFRGKWPACLESDNRESGKGDEPCRRFFQVPYAAGKSIGIIPLFSGELLQGVIALMWDYERRSEMHAHVQDTIRVVAAQTAMGMERIHLYSGVERIGLTDALTGLANRRMFNFLVERELNRSRRYGRPASLVMMDIDHFKMVNDQWGHQSGDTVLREIGHLMRANFRKLDFPARYGGEEFAVILPETPLEEAITFAERFRLLVERSVFSNGRARIPVTVSLGVASLGNKAIQESMSGEDFVHLADSALYEAKRTGRNKVVVSRG